ncbi:MAG: Glu/Leu/Phe/Val dehydrogenase dimerization domain-containing protein, partial [bacterium]
MNVLAEMQSYGHERVAFHHDAKTGLKAIIAIHSTVLGNALGGTRRWAYATEDDALYDVLRLSEGMTYKAAASGLAMGCQLAELLRPAWGAVLVADVQGPSVQRAVADLGCVGRGD